MTLGPRRLHPASPALDVVPYAQQFIPPFVILAISVGRWAVLAMTVLAALMSGGSDSSKGLFHPDHFSFGTALSRSSVEAVVQQVPGVLDRDGRLIRQAMTRLTADGVLVFSTNFRRFRLDEDLSEQFEVEDVTPSTLDKDFQRNPRIHQCWHIRHRV